jgi:hypothetical protein
MKRPKDIHSQPYHIQEYIFQLEKKLKEYKLPKGEVAISSRAITDPNWEGKYRPIPKSYFESKMKGYCYISDSFEVIQMGGCANGNDACVAHGIDFNDALTKLDKYHENIGLKLIETNIIDDVTYYKYG